MNSMGMKRGLAIGLAACAVLAWTPLISGSGAWAQTKDRVPITAENVKQKAAFVSNLVSKSKTVQVIESSNDDKAKTNLKEARGLHAQAMKDIDSGNHKEADDKLNRAVQMVNAEARRLSGQEMKDQGLTGQYEQRLGTVRAMLEAYSRVSQEKGRTDDPASKTAAVKKLVDEAAVMHREGRAEEAKQTLDKAYSQITKMVAELREGDQLRKTLSFDTPKDEYLYELDKNNSHQMLLRLTLSEQTLNPQMAEQVDKIRQDAAKLRTQAEEKAKAGDFKAAIDTIIESTQFFMKANRMAGGFVLG